jgi:uncharacterized protein (DUF433 family)
VAPLFLKSAAFLEIETYDYHNRTLLHCDRRPNPRGEPIIKGIRTPVRSVVGLWRLGIAPEEIPTHLPHLNLAQIFDALSYYIDHQDRINEPIERNRIRMS